MSKPHAPIFHAISVLGDTWANVYINDIPLFRPEIIAADSQSGPVNYLLKPGENEIALEVMRSGKHDNGSPVPNTVRIALYTDKQAHVPDAKGVDPDYLFQLTFPEIQSEVPERFRRLPFYYRTTFEVPHALNTPAFFSAPESDFSTEGTPALHEATERIFSTLERGAYDAFLDELELRFASDEASLPNEPAMKASAMRTAFMKEVLQNKPRLLRRYDPSRLIYESRRQGQVAIVRTFDDGPALQAICEDVPERRIWTDLYMVQHQGSWKAFA